MKREQEMLKELYAPVKARLTSDTSAPQEQDLEFSIRWDANIAQWLERGGLLFDQRKIIPYNTMDELSAEARKLLLPAWTSGDPVKIGEALDNFLTGFRKEGLRPATYLKIRGAPSLATIRRVSHCCHSQL